MNNEVATGTGPNKKVAKRNAAEAMLLQLGYKASTVPPNSAEVRALLHVLHQLVHLLASLYSSTTDHLFSCQKTRTAGSFTRLRPFSLLTIRA